MQSPSSFLLHGKYACIYTIYYSTHPVQIAKSSDFPKISSPAAKIMGIYIRIKAKSLIIRFHHARSRGVGIKH